MRLIIKLHFLFSSILIFILFVPIGTLFHEGGHIAVAQLLGYDTKLHYGSMNWGDNTLQEMQKTFYDKYALDNLKDLPAPVKTEYDEFIQKWSSDRFKVTLGGPLQTILTSLPGLFILFRKRKKRRLVGFKIIDWLAVFMSLFGLRTTFNVTYGMLRSLWKGASILTGGRSDEIQIASYLELPSWSLSVISGLIGLAIALYIVFGIVPKDKQLTFIFAGLIGGMSGYVLWLEMIGPLIMP